MTKIASFLLGLTLLALGAGNFGIPLGYTGPLLALATGIVMILQVHFPPRQ